MNQKEKELFLQLCAFRNPNAGKLKRLLDAEAATPEVLGQLHANRMAAVACEVLEKTGLLDHTDREFRNSLRNARLLNQKWNEDFAGCVQFVTNELEACGIPYALLKGAYLTGHYPKGCRTSNDIDVLLLPEDVGKASAKLKMAGLQQGHMKNGAFVPATRQEIIESKMTRGETVPFIRRTQLPYLQFLEVDLNFSLDHKNSPDGALRSMLDRCETVSVGGSRVHTLNRIDFLLHLCAHLYKEATTMPWIRMKRDMTLYKYCDIYSLLYDLLDVEIPNLISRAEELGLTRELFYCLHSVNSFFHLRGEEWKRILSDLPEGMDTVEAPAEKKLYRYRVSDPVKRFFAADRAKLLEEVPE